MVQIILVIVVAIFIVIRVLTPSLATTAVENIIDWDQEIA